MVRIRMSRLGRKHRPFFRINAVEKRTQRDGKILEALGWYDPMATEEGKSLKLDLDRVKHWLAKGAQPSDTVNDMLARLGVIDAEAWKKQRAQRKIRKMEADKADKAAVATAATETPAPAAG